MISRLKSLPELYYRFWVWFAHLKNKTVLIPVNFTTSWLAIIWQQKKYLWAALTSEMLTQVFYTLVPFLIGIIITQASVTYFYYLMAFWFLAIIGEYCTAYFGSLLEIQCINSIQYSAYEFFLTVDPIYHTTRSSGKLFAKIERCARGYEDFLDIIFFDLAPTCIGVITVICSFLWVDVILGSLAFVLLLVVGVINVGLNLFTGTAFETHLIKADDAVKSLSVESLTQVQLVRASFASNEIAHRARHSNQQMMYKEGTAWLASSAVNFITRIAYLISIFILGIYILKNVQTTVFTVTIGITLLITYIRGTYEIIRIGRKLRKLIKCIIRISDLYSFIQSFGKQTFPVLAEAAPQDIVAPQVPASAITLEVTDLHFDYNSKASIFDSHSVYLSVPRTQQNKLYGIIGPSGMGKTTLLSILGGQLRPPKGSVTVNGVSVYTINDAQRRKLLAVQGQIASNLSGTLKSNLLLGLPHEPAAYTNEEIITVLKEVGLWALFEEKEGLTTSVGEGGLTLSGGQRQRLNFAGLYLRARYYRPALILIDEPTSSLDEISEKAITTMINKLAHHALTIVIAHRLKTLDSAVAILDFSLLDTHKEIMFYTKEELEKKSSYYRRFIEDHSTQD